MPYIDNDGINIYYEIEGEGPPVFLVHGLGSSLEGTWKQFNWVETLKEEYQVILLDCRGHGKSNKPHEKEKYNLHLMGNDILKLMKHLSVEKANFFGYSMGQGIIFQLLLDNPQYFISAILGGGSGIIRNEEQKKAIREKNLGRIKALKADNSEEIKDPQAKASRQFLEERGNDLKALAALLEGHFQSPGDLIKPPELLKEILKKINIPVMGVSGSDDVGPWRGDKTQIAQFIPDACYFQIQGKDHITVVSDPKFKMVVKAFLDHVNK